MSGTNVKAPEVLENPVADEVKNENEVKVIDFKSVVKNLMLDGAKTVNAKVIGVRSETSISANGNTFIKYHLNINKNVKRAITNEMGINEIIDTNFITVTGYDLATMLHNTQYAYIADNVINMESSGKLLFTNAIIDFISIDVAAGSVIKNPFNYKDEGRVYDHDIIIYYPISCNLSEDMVKTLEVAKLKMLGL